MWLFCFPCITNTHTHTQANTAGELPFYPRCRNTCCCQWLEYLGTSASGCRDIHYTQYHYKQQGDTRAATGCEHTSSVVILHVRVPLCFHGCWLNVQVTVFSSGLFQVLFISLVLFLPLLLVIPAQHMMCLMRADVTITVPQIVGDISVL